MTTFVRFTNPLFKTSSCLHRSRGICWRRRDDPVCASSHRVKGLEKSQPQSLEPLARAVKQAPHEPGVYRFYDVDGQILYIGKARRLNARIKQYVTRDPSSLSAVGPAIGLSPRISFMITQARFLDFVVTQTEAAALALEASLVREVRPPYNVLLKDDRRHPFALVTFSEEYPRVTITRSRSTKHPKDRIYGPFVDEARLRRMLTVIHAVFPLRQRARPLFSDRPCINYDLGRCPAVCQKLISPDVYGETLSKVDRLLSGRVAEVLLDLRREMSVLSDALMYERAAIIRDQITLIQQTFNDGDFAAWHQSEKVASVVDVNPTVSRDVFAIATSTKMAKAALFQMRAGSVVSRLMFSITRPDEKVSDSELLSAVLRDHYAKMDHPMEIPEEVVLCQHADDIHTLRSILTEKRGKSVSVKMKAKKTKAIAEVVQYNAEMELQIDSERMKHTKRDLLALQQMLMDYFPQLGTVSKDSSHQYLDEGPNVLQRIECYDVSHTNGAHAVGAMSVFVNGVPASSEYRRFYLSESSSYRGHPDDFESIRETLRRRFCSSDSSSPDLVVIDGGKGQLSAAFETLRDLDLLPSIALVSIAKGEEAVYAVGLDFAINYNFESGAFEMSDGVRMLCRLRDEAHRFAVSTHRRRRGKAALRSGLDAIRGLGSQKRAALLAHFSGSAEAVAQAKTSELQKIPGIGPSLAQRIADSFT